MRSSQCLDINPFPVPENYTKTWDADNKVQLVFIQPEKSTQNGYVERFNGSVRKELSNAYVFRTISEVREKVQEWMDDYNMYRPHKALGY